ncbi:protein BLISTER-like isoform X1 [Musa acuminata AAA Group]|uniref:protein BLISTER-like isoform X1 n=2 Tax=Musa acuminata AAA Group TaxID=214697 RepID=UPI0031E3BB23
MASAKVMSNSVASSRKQGHLELGKKKLEEFRKKKAAKQVASVGHLQSTDVDQYENSSKTNQHKEDDSSGTGGTNVVKTSGVVISYEDKAVNSSQNSDVDLSTRMPVNSTAWNYNNHISHGNSEQEAVKDKVLRLPDSSTFSESANGYYDHWREKNELSGNEESKVGSADGFKADQHIAFDPDITKPYIDGNIHGPGFHLHNVESGDFENRVSSTSHMHDRDVSGAYNMSTLPEKSESISAMHTLGYPSASTKIYDVEKPFQISNKDNHGTASAGGRIADAISRRLNVDNSTWRAPESFSAGFSSGFGRSSGETFPVTSYGTTFGRSRPSFLDSLGVARVSSISNVSHGDPDSIVTPVSLDNSKFQNTEAQLSASLQQPSADNSMEQSLRLTTLDSTREKQSSFSTMGFFDEEQQPKQRATDQDIQRDHEFPSLKKDEDFASLEQHIEDLTKEKFSLQRALQTAQTLAESLAAENSSLTDSFNQQGKVVNQLKSDMERLQEEIKAQMLAFESVKLEYTNAQLECNAADERAKLLASEVISLEEKALRLRSNELKLEKQLENLNSEITSFKRKVSVLEKERQDFQSTVDALQEENKVLQSMLRKASTDGKTKHTTEISSIKQDASTSTDDLDVKDNENNAQGTMMNSGINAMQDVGPSAALSTVTASFLDDRRMDLPDAHIDLPHDQLRMIENIKALISELAVEKEELVQALRIESSNCSKLKDLNKGLSQKLEAQTQRLELLTSQRMANENVLAKPIDMHSTHETMEYADEGDEVVERVLGWIMKLFPGGPAKRRTSKLL